MTEVTQMRQTASATFAPAEIVRLAMAGKIRIPRFQRSFVWDNHDIRQLFDSIWKGYPIGTLLLWQHPQPPGMINFGSVTVKAPKMADALIVVDGQQRVTALVGALTSAPPSPPDPRFEVCFDLRSRKFFQAGKRPVPDSWLPVRVALESRTLIGWLRERDDILEPDELDIADAFGGSLRDYKIPAYVIEQDDESLLRDVFDRVNSAGKPINRAQVFHALFGGESEVGTSTAVINDLRREGFGDIDEPRVVQSLLAIRGGNIARDLHGEFSENEDKDDWFNTTSEVLSKVIRFFQGQGVPHLEFLPSTFPIPVLAAYYYVHPQPDPWNEQLLALWLWRGWVHGYGRSGQTPALRRAIQAVNPSKLDRESAPSEFTAVESLLANVIDAPPPATTESFKGSSAAGKLAMLALADLEPRRVDGVPLDLPALFSRCGAKAFAQLVPGYGSLLGARGLWDPGGRRLTGNEEQSMLSSHAITQECAHALKNRAYRIFVQQRGEVVQNLVNEFLTRRLRHGLKIRPPLEDLWVPDDGQ